MPLSPSDRDGEPDQRRQAIGFWMFVEGTRPAKPVRVFVTYEALPVARGRLASGF
jgi:hypothetical protein